MIPAVIVPYYSRPDMLRRMVDSLYLCDSILILNQSGRSEYLGGNAWEIRTDQLGFAGAVNLGIGQLPRCPWWLVASVDVTFGAGDLDVIAELMDTAHGPQVVTGDRTDERMLRFAYFALNAECVERVGLLDEWSFFPAYFEDDDYARRCRLGGVAWVEYNGNIGHDRSVTVADPALAEKNGGTFPQNYAAYVEKWGGPPGAETFVQPWGTGDLRLMRPNTRTRGARLWE